MAAHMEDLVTKPIFLLADSTLLFWRTTEGSFLRRLRDAVGETSTSPRAAYLGASNGDDPLFYQLFVAAMAEIAITDCHMIPTEPSAQACKSIEEADLILLAGGSVEQGWRSFQQNGLDRMIAERYQAGAVLVGVSAGAVQLGLVGWPEVSDEQEVFGTLGLVPLVVDAHDEPGWLRLRQVLKRLGGHVQGLGIPRGAGAVYHPDRSLEPVRRPLVEFVTLDDGIRESLLVPPGTEP